MRRSLATVAVLAAALCWAGPLRAQSQAPTAPENPIGTTAGAGNPTTHETGTPAGNTPTEHGAPALPEPSHEAGHAAGEASHGEGAHGEGAHGEGGEHGGKHEEGGVDIHLKTWLTGPLKQFYYSGPAAVTAAGAVRADNPTQPVDPAELNGKSFTYTYEDHHATGEPKPKYTTQATVTVAGKQLPSPGVKTEEVEIGGVRYLLVNPTAKFEREGMLPEGLVVSLITAILIAIGMFLMTRNLSRIPGKRQMVAEMIYGALDNFTSQLIGPGYKTYLPLIATAFIYIFLMNWGAIVPGWAAATANINVTAGLAIVVVVYVQFVGIRANGFKGYVMHFVGEPWWLFGLNVPIHLIGELAKVLSLTIRLFGNIFGEDVVLVILMFLAGLFFKGWIPVQFPMYFLVFFTSFVQAMVFSILTCVYISLMTAHHDEGHHGEHGHGHGDDHGHLHDTAAPATVA